MLKKLQKVIQLLDKLTKNKHLKVISHYDTDGITSAAIIIRALQRWKKQFSIEIVKSLEDAYIKTLPDNQIILFLDLASGSLNCLKEKNTEIIIFDHHEITQEIPDNVTLVNPHIDNHEIISSAGICYLFAKLLSQQNKDLAHLAVIGMVGDTLEKELNKTYDEIIKDSNTQIKKSILFYPSSRSLDKTLEYSTNPSIPGVTGSYKGALELLKDSKITKQNGKYKALYELSEEEMENLITSIILRGVNEKTVQGLIGNIFLVKCFNKLEDARECSAMINACSRMGFPNISLGLCLENKKSKEEAERIYYQYKQHLVAALKYVAEAEKISGKDYTIINAKNNIKDTIIGTVASILSHSPLYEKGTMIIALAYNEDKIKVSARMTGNEGRNVREVLHQAVIQVGGEVGGHKYAAGCLISKKQELNFLEELKKILNPLNQEQDAPSAP